MHAAHVKEDQQFGKYPPIPKLERNCLKKKKDQKLKLKKSLKLFT